MTIEPIIVIFLQTAMTKKYSIFANLLSATLIVKIYNVNLKLELTVLRSFTYTKCLFSKQKPGILNEHGTFSSLFFKKRTFLKIKYLRHFYFFYFH